MSKIVNLFCWELRNILFKYTNIISILVLFIIIFTIFILGFGNQTNIIAEINISIIWICFLLSMQLSTANIFDREIIDGLFEQIILSGILIEYYVVIKLLIYWLMTIIPLIILCVIIFFLQDINYVMAKKFIFSMLINSFTLSALCLFGAFLTSCSNKNNFLTPLIIMPLSIPILIIAINMAQNIDAINNLLLIFS